MYYVYILLFVASLNGNIIVCCSFYFRMSEAMDTTPAAVTFGATDVRIRMDLTPWAARQRQQRGLAPLDGDADLLLLDDLDLLTAPVDPSAAKDPEFPEMEQPGSSLQDLLEPLQPIVDNNRERSAKASFPCTACKCVYKDKKKLKGHWEVAHCPEFMGFCCPQSGCSRSFHPQNKGFFRSHMRQVHHWTAEQVGQMFANRLPLVSVRNQSSDGKAMQVEMPDCVKPTPPSGGQKENQKSRRATGSQKSTVGKVERHLGKAGQSGSQTLPKKECQDIAKAVQCVADSWSTTHNEALRRQDEERKEWNQERKELLQEQKEWLQERMTLLARIEKLEQELAHLKSQPDNGSVAGHAQPSKPL